MEVERAKWRNTLTYYLLPNLSVGIEYNPLAEKASPLANWIAVKETETTPALILGTSSDRIGTPTGQSFYATVSKDLENWASVPAAPYAGLAYGTYEEKLRLIAGLNLRLPLGLSALAIYDGVNGHALASYSFKAHTFSLVLVKGEELGASYSLGFRLW